MSDDEIETIDSFQLLPGWKHAEVTRQELEEAENIFELYADKGIPLNDPNYLRMGDYIKEEDKWVYQWIEKSRVTIDGNQEEPESNEQDSS